jgi:hypothetical protein
MIRSVLYFRGEAEARRDSACYRRLEGREEAPNRSRGPFIRGRVMVVAAAGGLRFIEAATG